MAYTGLTYDEVSDWLAGGDIDKTLGAGLWLDIASLNSYDVNCLFLLSVFFDFYLGCPSVCVCVSMTVLIWLKILCKAVWSQARLLSAVLVLMAPEMPVSVRQAHHFCPDWNVNNYGMDGHGIWYIHLHCTSCSGGIGFKSYIRHHHTGRLWYYLGGLGHMALE